VPIFVPSQIVCLEGQYKSLFCEVIELISSRSLCWVRPIILVNLTDSHSDYFNYKNSICDLRFTSDLLWDTSDFRIVLDTEYLELFTSLDDFEFEENKLQLANRELRYFIQELCSQKN
jgi:hypothetical protein